MSAINNKLNTWLLLGSVAVLGGCGLADTSSPLEEQPEDKTVPRVVSVTVDGTRINGTSLSVPLQIQQIAIEFNRKLDPNTVENAITVTPTITGLNVALLDSGTTVQIRQNPTTDNTNPSITLEKDKTYQITIGTKITDLQGKPLSTTYPYKLVTSAENAIRLLVTNLESGKLLKVKNKIDNIEKDITKANFEFDDKYDEGLAYEFEITKQPEDQFCNFPNSAKGVMGTQDVVITIACGNVIPVANIAPRWNDYIAAISDANLGVAEPTNCPDYRTADCRHGGELRKFVVKEASAKGYTSCNGVQISDEIGAFDWVCRYDTNNDTLTAVSTGLKSDKKLADLLDFNNGRWQDNKVKIDGGTQQIVSSASKWWDNPVLPATKAIIDATSGFPELQPQALDTVGGIYVESIDNLLAGKTHRIAADNIAYVVKTGMASHLALSTFGLARRNLWLEGKFDLTGTAQGILISNTHHSILRNLEITRSKGSGLVLEESQRNVLNNVSVHHNAANGLELNNGPICETIDGRYVCHNVSNNTLNSIIAMNNGGNGIQIKNGLGDSLTHSRTGFNDQSGLKISRGSQFGVTELTSYGNLNHGVELAYASNNIVLNTTLDKIYSAANGAAGIKMSGRSSTLQNLTLVKNGAQGLHVTSDAGTSNTVNGALVALNGGAGVVYDTTVTASNVNDTTAGTLLVGDMGVAPTTFADDIEITVDIDTHQLWHKQSDGDLLSASQVWADTNAGSCKATNTCQLFDAGLK